MNREILFRGKRRDNGEWIEGNFIDWGNHVQVYIFPLLDFATSMNLGTSINVYAKAVIPETVGQFTGVYDKNGDEIYEGDILEFAGAEIPEEERAEVVFTDGRFRLKNPHYDYMDDLDSLTASMEIIVGNTYDGIYRRGQEMKSVLISIQPKWVEKIANGEKTIEVRKTTPKQVPFKCYIYETKGKKYKCVDIEYPPITSRADLIKHANAQRKEWYENEGTGKVIGEFICDKVFLLHPYTYDGGNADRERRKLIQTFEGSSKGNEILATTCLTQDEMFDYIGADNYGYGWHISDLKIYDKPKELNEFYSKCNVPESKCKCCDNCFERESGYDGYYAVKKLTRAPQSWQYVEE